MSTLLITIVSLNFILLLFLLDLQCLSFLLNNGNGMSISRDGGVEYNFHIYSGHINIRGKFKAIIPMMVRYRYHMPVGFSRIIVRTLVIPVSTSIPFLYSFPVVVDGKFELIPLISTP